MWRLFKAHPFLIAAGAATTVTAATAATTAITTAAYVTNLNLTQSLLDTFADPPHSIADWGKVVELTCDSAARGGSCNVYLIGTRHYTQKSREEVRALIELVKPEVVFVEECPIRTKVLSDPESEFYVANMEAKKIGAKVILGDRPTKITNERLRVMKFLWDGLVAPFTLSYVNVAYMIKKKCIDKDDVGAYNLARDERERIFPSFTEAFITERDQYMSAMLLDAARQHKSVVAVVGAGHLRGIRKHWKQPIDVEQLLDTPPRTRMDTIVRKYGPPGPFYDKEV